MLLETKNNRECNSYISIQAPAPEKPPSKSRKNNGENPIQEENDGEKPFAALRSEKNEGHSRDGNCHCNQDTTKNQTFHLREIIISTIISA